MITPVSVVGAEFGAREVAAAGATVAGGAVVARIVLGRVMVVTSRRVVLGNTVVVDRP